MDIVLLSYGSRGDVQPYVALARALRLIGHQVRLVAPPNFAALTTDHGIAFASSGADIEAHLRARIQDLPQSSNVVRSLWGLRDELRSLIDDSARDTWQAAQGASLVIGQGPASAGVAEGLGVPFVDVLLQPLTPTRAFPSPVVAPKRNLGGDLNWLTHVAFEQVFWQLFRGTTNQVRTHVLGLPPYPFTGPLRDLRTHGLLRLYAYSPHVVPRPDDWPSHHQVTGYWFLPPPAGWEPPAELSAFLAAGPPPVYVGFGSMIGRDPQKMTALVTAALARSGQRGVLASGWGAIGASTPQDAHVCVVDNIPHHWLFPRMAAIVHHGGAGTTGAALRSGVPSVIVPHGFDQAFWGERITALGVGPSPLPRRTLTSGSLAAAIEQAVRNPQMRERAAQLGVQVQAEQGTVLALEHIHRVVRAR